MKVNLELKLKKDELRKKLDIKDGIDGKDGSPDTSIEVRDKLQSLIAEERLDASAIKNLTAIIYGSGRPAGGGSIGSVVTGGTEGSVLFVGVGGVMAQNNANFFWDDANNRLGLGIALPLEQLHMTGNIRLPATTLTVGQIRMGAIRWIDSFGAGNVFIGANSGVAGNLTLTGTYNIGIGDSALIGLTTGGFNVAIGMQALTAQTTSSNNVAIGYQAGFAVTTGIQLTLVGTSAGDAITTGSYSDAFGHNALAVMTTGQFNVAIGRSSLAVVTTGQSNVGLGPVANSATTSSRNIAIGQSSGGGNGAGMTGDDNVFVGHQSGFNITSGTLNVGLGNYTLQANTTGGINMAIGMNAMFSNTTGGSNSAIGYAALNANTTGSNNVAIGRIALLSNTTADDNTAIGYGSLQTNTTGTRLVAIGRDAGNVTVTVNDLTAVGYNALYLSTGVGNTALGSTAGNIITTGTNNTFLGFNADASSATVVNACAIGANSVVSASDAMVLGGTGANTVDVGIGVAAPLARLHVVEKTLGDEVARFESIATNDDPAEKVWQNRVATTTAAVTTLHTFAIPASTTFAINAVIVARRTGGAAGTAEDGARYDLKGVYKNVAGVATIIGAVTKIADESVAGWDGNLTVSAGNVLVEATGELDVNITWHMTSHTFAVST